MDRRTFIKKSTVAAVGGLLLSTPFSRLLARENGEEPDSSLPLDKHPMKVLLINGSARRKGNTFTALSEAAKQLEKNAGKMALRNAAQVICDEVYKLV